MSVIQKTASKPKPKIESFSGFLKIGVLGMLTLALYNAIVFQTSTVGSPDEAANRFVIDQIAQHGNPVVQTELSAAQLQYWHPRSILVDGTILKPGSFVGFMIFNGWLDRLTFDGFHRLLTPLLATLALFAIHQILRWFWSPSWSLLGTALVAVHPVWFQFQTLPDYHNGAFAALLIVSAWRLMRLWDTHRLRDAVWFGLVYGAALFFRPVEVLWTAPLVVIILLAQRQWRALGLAGLVTIIVQLPWLLTNQSLYGSIFSSGYATSGVSELLGSSDATGPSTPVFLTPPGGWSWNWIHSFWNYLILMVPAWGFAVCLGFMHYLRRIHTNRLKLLKISLISLGMAFLLAYYGSWNLYPLTTPSAVGSLASYARYWIPLYVAMVAGVLWLLKRIAAQRWLLIVAIVALFSSQIMTIIWHPSAGLLARFDQDRTQTEKKQAVLAATPTDAAIIAGQMDKVLFPHRLVAFTLPQSESQWQAVQSLLTTRQVYVYVTPQQYNYQRVSDQVAAHGLQLGGTTAIGGDQLWEIRL